MGRQWTQSLLQLGARSAPITSGTPGLLAAASPAVIGGGAVVMVFTLVMLNPNTHIYGRAQPRLSSDERRRREVLGGGDPVTMYNPPFSAPGADGGLEIFDPLPDDTLLLPGPDHGPPVEAPGGTPSDPVIDPPSGGNESVEAGRDGTYGSERKKSNADPQNPCEADHMVPNAVNPIPCRQAPAVSMEKGDHRDWLTTGSSHEAQDIRELLKEMIQENPQDGYVNAHLLITQLYIDRFGMKYAEASYEGLLALDELGISEPLYDYSLSELEELGQDELVREHALCPGGCFRSK